MNSRKLPLVLGALLVLAVLTAGVAGWQRFHAPPEGNLVGSSLGGPFALVDQDGRPRTDRDFAGRYRLMYFGYTFCPDVCPTDVALIAKGLRAYEAVQPKRAALVAPIFVTVDPERDDPASVKAFVGAFHPRLVGLTGPAAAVDAARKTFGIYARKVPTSDPENYLVDHFAVIYLFGLKGEPLAFLPHGSSAAEVTAMLEAQVR